MCCLFGIVDYKHTLSAKQQGKILSVLSKACEVRGTDATGVAYNTEQRLCIYKRPLPAHRMHLRIPPEMHTVMGHTRMTTQGDGIRNYNNHPFYGYAENTNFALAHNGVLHNDKHLRKSEKLPATKIETDSYVAVQLIEQKRALNFDSLRYMAEQLEGTFTITVLDREDNLYFVKGDNPMCIYHFEAAGIYIYASTEEILKAALRKIPYRFGKSTRIDLDCGDILRIDKFGRQIKAEFNTDKLVMFGYYPYSFYSAPRVTIADSKDNEYVRELKFVASGFGYTPEYVDYLLDEGFTTDDIEEILYCGAY